jgi:Putative MetA-pathway of phenol degradation
MIVEQNGVRSVRAHEADRDKLETAITARLGLPWRSQAELRVPYLRVSEDASDGVRSTGRSEFGLGDVELALAHQFLREDGWVPDLVGELRWSLPTGEDSFDSDGPALGTGFHGLGGRVTLLKTYDPVVFLGSLGYSESLEDEKKGFDIDPGDSWSVNLATILAAGPGVSLRTGFAMKFTDEAEVDGRELAGTDKTEGVLSLGAAVSLSPSILLDVGVGIGVTDDASDVSTKLALAYRF